MSTFPMAEVTKEPGCEQFEVFQSVVNPDKLAPLERWTDQKVLDAHAQRTGRHTPFRPDLRTGNTEREDYERIEGEMIDKSRGKSSRRSLTP